MKVSRGWYGSPGRTILGLIVVPGAAIAAAYWISFYIPDLPSSCLTGDQRTASEMFEPGLDAIEGLSFLWAGLLYWLTVQQQFALGKRGGDTRRQLVSFALSFSLFLSLVAVYFFWASDCLRTAVAVSSQIAVGPTFALGNLVSRNFWFARAIEVALASASGIQTVHWLRVLWLNSVAIMSPEG